METILSVPWLVQTAALGLLSLMFFWFKSWMASEFKDIKDSIAHMVHDETCKERTSKCSSQQCRKIDSLTVENKDQWEVINDHGHRGLDGDGNDVVRA